MKVTTEEGILAGIEMFCPSAAHFEGCLNTIPCLMASAKTTISQLPHWNTKQKDVRQRSQAFLAVLASRSSQRAKSYQNPQHPQIVTMVIALWRMKLHCLLIIALLKLAPLGPSNNHNVDHFERQVYADAAFASRYSAWDTPYSNSGRA